MSVNISRSVMVDLVPPLLNPAHPASPTAPQLSIPITIQYPASSKIINLLFIMQLPYTTYSLPPPSPPHSHSRSLSPSPITPSPDHTITATANRKEYCPCFPFPTAPHATHRGELISPRPLIISLHLPTPNPTPTPSTPPSSPTSAASPPPT